MLYNEYKNKIEKIAKVFKYIAKNIVLFSIIAVVFISSITFLLVMKGRIISEDLKFINSFYGESFSYKANAFLSSVHYEYSFANESNWHEGIPTEVGSYKIRSYGKSSFGKKLYSKEKFYTINKKPLDVIITNDKILFGDEFTINGKVLAGHSLVCENYNYKDNKYVGSCVVEPDLNAIYIYDNNGNDVTKNYEITPKFKNVEVLKRDLSITINSVEKEYDEKPLSSNNYEVKGDINSKHILEVKFSKSIVNIGEIENSADIKILNGKGEIVNFGYNITVNVGKLKIKPILLEINSNNVNQTYDGTYHDFSSNYEIIKGSLLNGHRLISTQEELFKNVGLYENDMSFKVVNSLNIDVSNYYNINFKAGTIKITKRSLCIESNSNSWLYDGTTHTDKAYLISEESDGLAYSEKLILNWNNGIKYVGEQENSFTYDIVDIDNNSTIANYNVTYSFGVLTIEKRILNLQSLSDSWLYDGRVKTLQNYVELSNSDGVALNETLILNWNSGIKNAGKIENSFDCHIEDVNGLSTNDNYDIVCEFGYLEIFKRTLNITTPSEVWTYDGYYHQNFNYVIENDCDGLVESEEIHLLSFTQIKNYGELDNNVEIFIIDLYGYSTTDNYLITYNTGLLSINKRNISIKTGSNSWEYNGFLNTEERILLTSGNLADGDYFMVTSATAIEDVGDKINKLEYIITNDYLEDLTQNYNVEESYGTISVYKRNITTLTGTKYWQFDGEEHYYKMVYVIENSIPDGQTIEVQSYSTITYLGEVDNIIDFIIVKDDRDVTFNYKITEKYGKIFILEDFDDIPDGPDVPGEEPGDNPDNPNVPPENPDNPEEDDTPEIEVPTAKKDLVITPKYTYKIYDGTPIYAVNEITLTYDIKELLDKGYTYEVVVDGCQTMVGVSLSEILDFKLYDSERKDVTDNFNIIKEYGVVEVCNLIIKMYLYEIEKTYDGLPLYYENYEDMYEFIDLPDWLRVNVYSINISQINYGVITASMINSNVHNYINYSVYVNDVDVTNSVKLLIVNDKLDDDYYLLKINKAKITLQSESETKVYDGTALNNSNVSLVFGGLANNHEIIAKTNAEIIEIGSIENTISYYDIINEYGISVKNNYEVTTISGTLTVKGN